MLQTTDYQARQDGFSARLPPSNALIMNLFCDASGP